MRFVVPPVSFPSQDVTQMQMAVHLTSCASPHAPLVCAESFTYGREKASSAINSDEDSEDTPDSSVCDDDDDDEDSSRESSSSSSSSSSTSPKQLMTVRERMLEFVNSTPSKSNARVIVAQAPPNRVVWKNRRLDTPFKIRVEGPSCDTSSTKLTVLALVVDHKGKLQIDAMENFDEECNPQGLPFSLYLPATCDCVLFFCLLIFGKNRNCFVSQFENDKGNMGKGVVNHVCCCVEDIICQQ